MATSRSRLREQSLLDAAQAGPQVMIAMLAGYDIVQLDNSMCNRNGEALLEAYKGTEIFCRVPMSRPRGVVTGTTRTLRCW